MNMYDYDITKYELYFDICVRWLYHKNRGDKLIKYFNKENIKSIAVYGCGELGKRVIEELLSENVTLYALDKNSEHADSPIKINNPFKDDDEKEWMDADVVLVTSEFYFNEVYKDLKSVGYKNRIITFSDVLMNM